MTKTIEVWTDGASSVKARIGGWGFITSDKHLKGYGGASDTTNQRMELTAAGKGIRAVLNDVRYEDYSKIIVVSDSRYLVDCFQKKWYKKWIENDWKTSAKEPVKNDDIWKGLIKIMIIARRRNVTVEYRWVKGHSGEELNEIADTLAVKGKEAQFKLIAKQG